MTCALYRIYLERRSDIKSGPLKALFGGRLSFMSMQFTESKYEQHTTVVSGPYYLERCKHQPVLQNLVKLDRIEKANCIFE